MIVCHSSASITIKISAQKQLGCKKSVVLFKVASVKKVVKSKGGGQEMAVMV